ncbi:MAG: cation:proton antiporter [Flavobacteriales bacterium]|nr:cation:proton antiporter [Flavobacteriales bacterium]
MQVPLLKEIVLILGLSVLMILLFKRMKLPELLGFLATGAIFGPHGFGLVSATETVELLAEAGVIFLLLVIGIEFSLKSLASTGRTVLLGGSLQVAGTVGGTALIGHAFGMAWSPAVFLGFLFALSSTAIVLKLLQEKGTITAPHGRVASAMLIFQDIIVVPMILLTPLLAGRSSDPWSDLFAMVGKMLVLLVLVYVLARFVVPRLLDAVVRTHSRELFIATIVALCFSTAWLTSALGLSLALGAFFAGLIISESEHRFQATGNILPFHEVFISFFFVSIGMLLDLHYVWTHLLQVVFFTLIAVLLKSIVGGSSALALRYPLRTALLTGLSLGQVGEFAFILSATGIAFGLLDRDTYQLFLSVSIFTMGLTPFLVAGSERLVAAITRMLIPAPVRRRLDTFTRLRRTARADLQRLQDHLVIIGFGLTGKHLSQTARLTGVAHAVIEMSPELAEEARSRGVTVVAGDATNDHVLDEAGVTRARVIVVAISDPVATRTVVARIRHLSDAPYIIVRTRYVSDMDELKDLGANDVVPEEFETSIEIFSRALRRYLVPEDEVEDMTARIRGAHYQALRSMEKQGVQDRIELHASELELAALPIRFGRNKVVGHRLVDADVKGRFGVSVLAIRRGPRVITSIDGDTRLQADDILYVLGPGGGIGQLDQHLRE